MERIGGKGRLNQVCEARKCGELVWEPRTELDAELEDFPTVGVARGDKFVPSIN